MRLLEFQAKRIFADCGIPVPQSRLLRATSDADDLALPAVLKAQVPIGGRGKAGGIHIAENASEAPQIVEMLMTSEIRGYAVQSLLAEAVIDVEREIYLALLLDKRTNLPLIMASEAGGVDIEQVAEEEPEKIITRHVDPAIGVQDYIVRYLARALDIEEVGELGHIVSALYDVLWATDATLVEINPLAQTPQGLMALDAKMVLDDKAAFRHPDLFAQLREEQEGLDRTGYSRAERLARQYDVTYVPLDGDVAMIADGAGTGMLTLDMIEDAGGSAANFCEMGGMANAEITEQSMEVVLANPNARSLLITLIGGLTRMDEIAEGIAAYLEAHETPVPLVVRMCGTQEEVGKAILREVGVRAYDDMAEAVRSAVALARKV